MSIYNSLNAKNLIFLNFIAAARLYNMCAEDYEP